MPPLWSYRIPVMLAAVTSLGVASQPAAGDQAAERANTCGSSVRELSFVSHRVAGGLGQIFRLSINRPTKVTRVTHSTAWATSPTWSPDGKRVAYREWSPKTREGGIYIARADGSNPVRIREYAADPVWSPDGRWLAVANMSPRGIGILDVEKALSGDRSAYKQVTSVSSLVPEEWATWSPDGKRLAFTSQRTGDSDVWVVDVNGRNLRNLTRNPNALDDSPSWSPGGNWIAFGSSRDSASQAENAITGDIYVMDLNGRIVKRLTRAPRGSYGPEWSPDGELIAFNSQRDGNSEVYVMRADGTNQRRLTRHREADGIVAWVGRGCTR